MASIEDRWKESKIAVEGDGTGWHAGRVYYPRNGKPGRWKVVWRVRRDDGTLGKRTASFDSKREAVTFRDRKTLEEQRERAGMVGDKREPHAITFADVVAQWELTPVSTRKESVEEGTTATMRPYMRAIQEHFGSTTLDAVRADKSKVRGFVDAIRKENIGTEDEPRYRRDKTVREYVTALGAIYSLPYEFGWTMDRLTKPDLPKINAKPRKFAALSMEQVREVCDNVADDYKVMFQVLAATGMRISELRGLKRDDLDVVKGIIHVRGQATKNGDAIKPYPKSDNGFRELRIAALPNLLTDLRLHLASTAGNAAKRPEWNLVFPNANGRAHNLSNLTSRVWIPARKATGLPEAVTMHHLRRTFGSYLMGRLGDLQAVARLMGDDAKTVLAHYVVERPESQAQVDDVLADLYGTPKRVAIKRVAKKRVRRGESSS